MTQGYILEQLLLSLGICAFLIPVAAVLLAVLVHALHPPFESQDESGITQLRHVIAVGDEFECSSGELHFRHRGKQQNLHLSGENLILSSPGTQIFLTGLSQANIHMEGGMIYLTYAHPEKEAKTACLGHE